MTTTLTDTVRLGLIGDNIADSKSPRLHELAGRLIGRPTAYDRLVPKTLGLDFDAVFEKARAEGFRGLKLRRHQAREKAFSDLCKKFTKEAGRKTIVGLGNWGNDPGGIVKGHPVGPVKGFGKWLRRCCIVMSIDEHRTSMLHHLCHMEMVGQRVKIFDKDGKLQPRVSYSGRYCQYCHDHSQPEGFCVNRDYSAAWNMPMLLLRWVFGLPTPLNFQRGVKHEGFLVYSGEPTWT